MLNGSAFAREACEGYTLQAVEGQRPPPARVDVVVWVIAEDTEQYRGEQHQQAERQQEAGAQQHGAWHDAANDD